MVDKLSGRFDKIKFLKVDIEDDQLAAISDEYGIRALPTFLVFKDGEKIDELVGASPGKLEEKINTANNHAA